MSQRGTLQPQAGLPLMQHLLEGDVHHYVSEEDWSKCRDIRTRNSLPQSYSTNAHKPLPQVQGHNVDGHKLHR